MSTISPDQLPTPIHSFGAPGRRPDRRRPGIGLVAAALGGLVLLGGAVAATSGSDDRNTLPAVDGTRDRSDDRPDDGSGAGGGEPATNATEPDQQVGSADLEVAYASVLGTEGSSATLQCVADQINGSSGLADEVTNVMNGARVSFEEAQRVFTPFVACAPDDDFLAAMMPAVAGIVGAADEMCVADILIGLTVEGRAAAHAMFYADPDEFTARTYDAFIGCAV